MSAKREKIGSKETPRLMARLRAEARGRSKSLACHIEELQREPPEKNTLLTWAAPINASLAYANCFILLWLGLMWILDWRKIFIKA